MKWYANSVFIGSLVLGTIACLSMWLLPAQEAKDIVVPIVAGIAGVVTGTAGKITNTITNDKDLTPDGLKDGDRCD